MGDVAPTLTDGVIVLDGHRDDDLDAHLAGEDDEHARRFGWYPARSTEATVREAFARWRDSWRRGGAERAFAVRLGATGELVGGCELRLAGDGRAETSYWTFPPHRCRGYARRALSLLSAWAFAEAGVERLEAHVEADNVASARVAEAAGFKREGLLRADAPGGDRRSDLVVYALASGDAQAAVSRPSRRAGR